MGEKRRKEAAGSTALVQMSSPNENPIMIEVFQNPIMGAFDVVLTVGNFRTEEEARRSARILVKMVERDLGSTPTSLAKSN
jgi:hypothetical protein